MKNTPVKIAILGTGRIGKLHIENISSLKSMYEIVAIADPYAKNLAEIAAEYSIPNYETDYQKVLAMPEVEAVVIATSTDTHAEIIEAAAKAKKQIFCEKPLDTDINRIKQILKVVEEEGVSLQIGFNRRYDHNFKRVKEYVEDGAIGNPHIIKVTSRDPEPPGIEYVKISGGLFSDMMIHDFDMVRYLSGSEVVEVYANGAVLVNPEIGEAGDVDTAIVTLKFENGAIGVIDNSRQAVYGYDQRVEVFGSKGQVAAQNDRPNTVSLESIEGASMDRIPNFFLDRYEQAYRDQFKGFYSVLKEGKQPIVTGIDGLRSVEIAQAALKSLAEHKPVQLVN